MGVGWRMAQINIHTGEIVSTILMTVIVHRTYWDEEDHEGYIVLDTLEP